MQRAQKSLRAVSVGLTMPSYHGTEASKRHFSGLQSCRTRMDSRSTIVSGLSYCVFFVNQ